MSGLISRDPIIVRFIEEALVTIKAGSNLGCAFLLGGASEKAIYLVIDTYTAAIKDEKSSFMMWFAERLDYKAGRQYYTIPTEIIARLGEQYVFDKIGQPLKEHITPQYALGFEKEKIMEHFGAWVKEAVA